MVTTNSTYRNKAPWIATGIVLALCGGALAAQFEMWEFEGDAADATATVETINKFRIDHNGTGIGCYNTEIPSALESQLTVEANNPKAQAAKEYLKASRQFAQATSGAVMATEEYFVLKWDESAAVQTLPWFGPRYRRLRDHVLSRLAWAKGELSNHSCVS